MKYTIKSFAIFFLFFAFFNSSVAQEQEDINISVGFGIPELASAGVRFQLKQIQIGFTIGAIIPKDESIFSFCSDVYFHFGRHAQLSERKRWYAQVGLNYLWESTRSSLYKYSYINTRLGREFNITRKIGMQLSGGVLLELSNSKPNEAPSTTWGDFDNLLIPSVGLGIFFRI